MNEKLEHVAKVARMFLNEVNEPEDKDGARLRSIGQDLEVALQAVGA